MQFLGFIILKFSLSIFPASRETEYIFRRHIFLASMLILLTKFKEMDDGKIRKSYKGQN